MFWSLLYDILTFTDLYNFVIPTIAFMINTVEWMKHFWLQNKYILSIISEYIHNYAILLYVAYYDIWYTPVGTNQH